MRARDLVVRTAEWCGVFVLVVAALPLVALAGFVARGVAVLVAAAGLLGMVLLCVFNPALRVRVARALGLTGPAGPALPFARRAQPRS